MPDTAEDRRLAWDKTRFFIASIGGAALFLIGLWQFTVAARNDFARPVLEKQLELCLEASETAALLSQPSSRTQADWRAGPDARTFLALYYGKLGVVEDQCLYRSMVRFKASVFDGEALLPAEAPPRSALRIAFACRRLLSKNWSAGLVGLYDPQNLLESFTDLPDYRDTMNGVEECRVDAR